MFANLLPKETCFFDYFEMHAALILEAAQLLQTQIEKGSFTPEMAKEIKDLEHQADDVAHRCIEALHRVFITPIDREEIYRLIGGLDDIIDCIDAAADCLVIYKIQKTTPELKKLAAVIVSIAIEVEKALKGMRSMKNVPEIRRCCKSIHSFENEADTVLRFAIGKLFEEEPQTREVIKWKEIYETLEAATDRGEDTANTIEGIILESD